MRRARGAFAPGSLRGLLIAEGAVDDGLEAAEGAEAFRQEGEGAEDAGLVGGGAGGVAEPGLAGRDVVLDAAAGADGGARADGDVVGDADAAAEHDAVAEGDRAGEAAEPADDA